MIMKSMSKKVVAIFAYNDLMALGAADFYEGKKDRPIIVGFDGLAEAQSAILSGSIDATIVQTPDLMGETAVKLLSRCVKENKYPQEMHLTHVSLLKATRILTSISNYK
jgi:ABC-type sugar transport system substrate-binding protein